MTWSQSRLGRFRLEIAHTTIINPLDDIGLIEDAVAESALYREFRDRFQQAFEVMNEAASYWVGEDLTYSRQARQVSTQVFMLRDVIYEQLCNSAASSLPAVIRRVLHEFEGVSDSRLAASYAFAQALDAVCTLADWVFDVEQDVYGINLDLVESIRQNDPELYQSLVAKERRAQGGREAEVRETFAWWVAESEKVLMLADLYRQSEVALASGTLQPGSFFPAMIDRIYTAKTSEKARSAGRGNGREDAVSQVEKRKKQDLTRDAVGRVKNAYPGISHKELLSRLIGTPGIGARDTILSNLRALGEYPARKKRKTNGPC